MSTTPAKWKPDEIIDGVNWNSVEDDVDIDVWERVTGNFWLPEKIPVSNDIPGWNAMTEDERQATREVFASLTLLDTIQGTVGAVSLIPHATTEHEEHVYTNFAFMESVHAKSYSNIFMTLSDTPEINAAFRWARENEELQNKASIIMENYRSDDPQKMRAASTMLESFLFYSGFYLPLRFSGVGSSVAGSVLNNTADIIRLILRDEAVHGYYIGYKYQRRNAELSSAEQKENSDFVDSMLYDLMENELQYTEDIYDKIGWTEDIKGYLKYNANKALNNLGYEGVYPADETNFHPAVRTSLDPSSMENHDFFSGSGSSYVIGKAEDTEDDDWDF